LVNVGTIKTGVSGVRSRRDVIFFGPLALRKMYVPWPTPPITVLSLLGPSVRDTVGSLVTMRDVTVGVGAYKLGSFRIQSARVFLWIDRGNIDRAAIGARARTLLRVGLLLGIIMCQKDMSGSVIVILMLEPVLLSDLSDKSEGVNQ
jgi:hypothetical protein